MSVGLVGQVRGSGFSPTNKKKCRVETPPTNNRGVKIRHNAGVIVATGGIMENQQVLSDRLPSGKLRADD